MKKWFYAGTLGVVLLVFTVSGYPQGSGFSFPLPTGYFRAPGDNEVELTDTSAGDPVKVRLGAQHGYGLGAISVNRVRANGVPDEAALIYGKLDDRYPGQLVGMWDIFVQRPGVEGDAGMIRKMEIYWDRVVFHGPVEGISGGSAYPSAMWSSDGHYVTQQQDDGNFVTYYLMRAFDRSQFLPVWSAWSGKLN